MEKHMHACMRGFRTCRSTPKYLDNHTSQEKSINTPDDDYRWRHVTLASWRSRSSCTPIRLSLN